MSNSLDLRNIMFPGSVDIERLLYEQRFYDRVMPEPNTGCWLWIGHQQRDGYGQLKCHKRRKQALAHRVSWWLTYGDVPAGLCVCHKCDTKQCVNPQHLFLGTTADNTADMVSKNRQARGSRVGLAKLNEKDVPVIRRLSADGWSQQRIADKYGIDQTQISKLLRGKTWSHVVSEETS